MGVNLLGKIPLFAIKSEETFSSTMYAHLFLTEEKIKKEISPFPATDLREALYLTKHLVLSLISLPNYPEPALPDVR